MDAVELIRNTSGLWRRCLEDKFVVKMCAFLNLYPPSRLVERGFFNYTFLNKSVRNIVQASA